MYVLFFFLYLFPQFFFLLVWSIKVRKIRSKYHDLVAKLEPTVGRQLAQEFFFFIDLRTCHALPLAKYTQNMPVIHLKSCQFSQWTCFEIRKTQRNSVSFFSISFWSWLDNEKAYVLCAHTLLEIQHIHIHTLGQYDVYTVRIYIVLQRTILYTKRNPNFRDKTWIVEENEILHELFCV